MTSATALTRGSAGGRREAAATASVTRRRTRVLAILALFAALLVVWETAKWIGGDPWRVHGSILDFFIPAGQEHVRIKVRTSENLE